uniref:Protein ECT2-like n=1 Tax=Phallusia mammillata TaxID=59560 RepID=A0A6F9DBR4_9ASCI|nr:protein ECT2-like [Phallusia mammillata]
MIDGHSECSARSVHYRIYSKVLKMGVTQTQFVIALLSGASLFLHLCSAGNFIPDAQTWLIGTIFKHLHSLCNIAARLGLISTLVLILMEQHMPDTVQRLTDRYDGQSLPPYITKFLTISLFTSTIRFILPGPISTFSRIYKLGLMINFAATVVSAIDANSHSTGRSLMRQKAQRRSDRNSDDNRSSRSSTISDDDIPSKRRRTAMELLQTETSYLRNLNTIIKVYKEPLEKMVSEGRPLLAPEDIRSAFGGITDIAALHSSIHHDLSSLFDNWDEECCIANIIIKYEDQLMKVYPPYVNFFDMGKETLLKRQKSNPDLDKFLKDCFNEPQSLKQPLDALLIRPVQRLPSISLLINDLRRRTPEYIGDHQKLSEAGEVLKKVLSHINEDKRKTEGKMKMVDIVYEVDGCPVEVVSSNRMFMTRIDVTTLTDGFYRVGERLALYLLTDVLEIAKWRNRSHGKSAPLLKHVEMLPLENIIRIFDICDSEETRNMFAVKYITTGSSIYESSANPTEEKFCVLQILDDRTFKSKWIQSLGSQITQIKNLNNIEDVVKKMDTSELVNFVKKGTKLYKKLKGKHKAD